MTTTVEIPDEWREVVHPRRGGVPGPPVVLDENAARTAREWERAARPIAEEMLAHEHTVPELGQAVRAWLDGEPDPVGAAAVASIAMKCVPDAGGAAFLDAWVLDHGLAFAACAVTEATSIVFGPKPRRSSGGRTFTVSIHTGSWWKGYGQIRRLDSEDHPQVDRWVVKDGVLLRLRTLLAAAPEAEYRDAVTRLAAHRGDATRCCAACYLVPAETAWVSRALDLSAQLRGLPYEYLLYSLSSAEHVDRTPWAPPAPAVLGTLLEGLGTAALPLLVKAFENVRSTDRGDACSNVLKAILRLPDERIFPILLDRIGEAEVPAALQEAIARYPVQAVRALAPLADDATPRGLQAAGLLRQVLHTDPRLAAELPPGACEGWLPRPPVPDSDDLPDVLKGRAGRTTKVEWADPATLPQILTCGRDRALPVEATWRLLVLLARKAPEAATVREFCDRHSLAEFSWALFQRWYALGAPSRHNWALAQLGLLGDDTTARRIVPLIKLWAGSGSGSRAAAALNVLAAIGSDVAVTHLFELARRGRYKGLKGRAAQKIDEIAAARGVTPDVLADRAVPDFGLDEQGVLVLDYGPRRFTVTFDEHLTPLVVEPNGRIRKSAPKPGPKDDPTLAPAAHALFTGLRKDLRTVADREVKRLELAMITQRSWTPEDFRTLFVAHPLLGHLTRRLVWITDDGTAFRIAEDRTYADVNDDPFTPAPRARIRVAHPIRLDDDLDAWVELFADYEILQPFPQLGRPVYRLTDQERAAYRLTRAEGLVLPYGKAKGHSQGRWESVDAEGRFTGRWLARRDPAGLYVVANLSPGIDYYVPYNAGDEQEITAVWAGPAPANAPADPVPLGRIDPLTMSEAIHDLVHSAS